MVVVRGRGQSLLRKKCLPHTLRKNGWRYGFNGRLGLDWEGPNIWLFFLGNGAPITFINRGARRLPLWKLSALTHGVEIPKRGMNKWMNEQVLHLKRWLLKRLLREVRTNLTFTADVVAPVLNGTISFTQYGLTYHKGLNWLNCPDSHPQAAPIYAWSEPLRSPPTNRLPGKCGFLWEKRCYSLYGHFYKERWFLAKNTSKQVHLHNRESELCIRKNREPTEKK